MTAHELARKLLEMPDVDVVLADWSEGRLPPYPLEENEVVWPHIAYEYVRDEENPGYWLRVSTLMNVVILG